jgi:hypothetical protein
VRSPVARCDALQMRTAGASLQSPTEAALLVPKEFVAIRTLMDADLSPRAAL